MSLEMLLIDTPPPLFQSFRVTDFLPLSRVMIGALIGEGEKGRLTLPQVCPILSHRASPFWTLSYRKPV